MFGVTEEQISEIDRLVKLNNTISDISTTTEVEIKIVAKVLVDLNLKTMIGLKSSITKQLKEIESEKLIDSRKNLKSEIDTSINAMYDNYKWVIDNLMGSCKDYYQGSDFSNTTDTPSKEMIEELLKVVKRGDLFVEISVEQKLTFNLIVQYLIHINKNIKTTISKRLSKLEAEVKKDQRKLIRLDIEDLINDMYSIYKLFTKEYGACCESNEFNINFTL